MFNPLAYINSRIEAVKNRERSAIHNWTDENGVVWGQRLGYRRSGTVVVTRDLSTKFKVLDPNFVHERLSNEELRNDPMYAAMTVAAGASALAIAAGVGALIAVA